MGVICKSRRLIADSRLRIFFFFLETFLFFPFVLLQREAQYFVTPRNYEVNLKFPDLDIAPIRNCTEKPA